MTPITPMMTITADAATEAARQQDAATAGAEAMDEEGQAAEAVTDETADQAETAQASAVTGETDSLSSIARMKAFRKTASRSPIARTKESRETDRIRASPQAEPEFIVARHRDATDIAAAPTAAPRPNRIFQSSALTNEWHTINRNTAAKRPRKRLKANA